MNRPKLLCVIACVCASAGSALAQYGQTAPGVRSAAPGGVGASVSSLSGGGPPIGQPPASPSAASSPPTSPPPFSPSPVKRAAHPAVVRVVAPGRGSVSYGSGSLVAVNDQHGLVITNWHVINEATGQVTVEFPDGFESPATIQKVDRDWDLAALAIWRPPVAPVPLAREAPRPGELLTIAGYGPGKYRAVSGQCTQYVAPGQRFPYEMVELAAAARQGDSGGPILNSRGELAGVLFGEGQGRTAGSYCGRVQWFLESVMGRPAGDAAPNSLIAQAPFIGPSQRAPLAKVPSKGDLASEWPPRNQALPQRSETWPPHGDSPPAGSSAAGLASASQSWRSNSDAGYQTPAERPSVATTAKAEVERPLQVAAVGKGSAEPVAESAGPPAGVSDSQAVAASGESPASMDRWEQIKAFGGVIAGIGLLLLVIRSLAAAGVEPNAQPAVKAGTKQKAAK